MATVPMAMPARRASGAELRSVASDGRDRVQLSGVLLDRVRVVDAARSLARYAAAPRMHQVVAVNLDCLRIAQVDADFRETINEADLAVADGMPLVWASRLGGRPLPERVTGNSLVEKSCELSAATGAGIFLLGARPGVAEAAARTIATRYPGAVVAGAYSPPFGPLYPRIDREMVRRVNRSGARILLVALGAPRQDNWIRAHRHELNVGVAFGVGCGIDLLAGLVPRAPLWMQRAGLEWLHRFRCEPERLWQRYFINDTPMLARLVAERLRAVHG